MRFFNRMKILFAAITLSVIGAHMAQAEEVVNALENDVAMDGFDVVAYFSDATPKVGTADHSIQYKGKLWRFSSAANAEKFAANPADYEPQNNGWCSYAVSEGYGAEVDFVNGWVVIDDKLYLNWDEETRDLFIAEQADRIVKAETKWPGVHAGLKDGTTDFYTHAGEGVPISHPQVVN